MAQARRHHTSQGTALSEEAVATAALWTPHAVASLLARPGYRYGIPQASMLATRHVISAAAE